MDVEKIILYNTHTILSSRWLALRLSNLLSQQLQKHTRTHSLTGKEMNSLSCTPTLIHIQQKIAQNLESIGLFLFCCFFFPFISIFLIRLQQDSYKPALDRQLEFISNSYLIITFLFRIFLLFPGQNDAVQRNCFTCHTHSHAHKQIYFLARRKTKYFFVLLFFFGFSLISEIRKAKHCGVVSVHPKFILKFINLAEQILKIFLPNRRGLQLQFHDSTTFFRLTLGFSLLC